MSRPFRFKRFTITQERAAMKVGTDGVLLGAWCTVGPGVQRAIDIGTGTGLIALMLAQRAEPAPLNIDAVEPDEGAFGDALSNISASPWKDSVCAHNVTIGDFMATGNLTPYDLIVCNPPYFTSSLLPPDGQRTSARHDVSLGRDQLAACSARMSRPGTVFAVIIPYDQAGGYITSCDLAGFTLGRRTDVATTHGAAPKRSLLEFVFKPHHPSQVPDHDILMIETSPLVYTEEYKALTREFYLKF